MKTDVLIVGGGPGGLTAALETGAKGLEVTIIDESWMLGGQLPQQTQTISPLPDGFSTMRGYELREKLIRQLKDYNINYLLQHTLVGVYEDGSFGVSGSTNVFPIHASKVILATGASESAIPFPKWTLPGIMTIGAAQIFINRERIRPGRSAIIVGSSDFALEVAQQLEAVGVEVHGIVEKNNKMTSRNQEYAKKLELLNIPVFLNTSIETAVGKEQVEKIILKKDNTTFDFEVDLVCIDGERKPVLEPFSIADCAFNYKEILGGWIPNYNIYMETSKPNVYLSGNAAGITCHAGILLTGFIAGINVAESMGSVSRNEAAERTQLLWKDLYHIESAKNSETWEARLSHITSYMKADLPVNPDQWEIFAN